MERAPRASRIQIVRDDEEETEVRSIWFRTRVTRAEKQVRVRATTDLLEVQVRTRRRWLGSGRWRTTFALDAAEISLLDCTGAEVRLLGALLIASFEVPPENGGPAAPT